MRDDEDITILLVDDRPENLLALEAALDLPGYRCVKAASGAEALTHLKGCPECALILLDVQMPVLDGYGTAREIRLVEALRAIPIIFVTAISRDEGFAGAGYAAGAVDYLFKPLDIDILRAKVAIFAQLYRQKRKIESQALALQISERREREFFLEQALDGVIAIDENEAIVYWNQEAERIFGWAKTEVLGRKLNTLIIPARFREAHARGMRHFLATGEGPILNRRIEVTALRRDGSEFPMELTVTPEQAQGRTFFYSFLRDISARLAAEAERTRFLAESEAQFRSLANSLPLLAWMAHADGHIFWYNQRWYEYTGTTPAQMEGWGWKEVHHPDLLPQVMMIWPESIRSGEHFEMEFPLRGKDGAYRWFLTRATPVRDANGRIVKWLGTNTDIEDQRRARESLQNAAEELNRKVTEQTRELSESKAFLDSLIENLPNMVFVKDAKELRFVQFNRAGEILVGYSRRELLGKTDYDLFPKEQADAFTAQDRLVLAGRDVVDVADEELRTATGIKYLHTKKIPLLGPDGKPEFLLGISEDITGARLAEAERLRFTREQTELRERAEAARRSGFLAEASATLSASLDYRETLARLGRLAVPFVGDWCTITMVKEDGVSLERVTAVHADLSQAETLEALLQYYPASMDDPSGISGVIESGTTLYLPNVTEEQLKAAARDARHLELMKRLGCVSCIAVAIRSGKKIHGALTFVLGAGGRTYSSEDVILAEEIGRRAGIAIENSLLYETAQTAIRARDDFLAIASHELKTPITSLKLQLEITRRSMKASDGPPTDKMKRMLEVSSRQIERLTGLVDVLLDVTRIEAGKVEYLFEGVDLAELVREAVERLAEAFRHESIEITLQAEPAPVVCDRYRIDQVVVNLLTNALKYGAGGKVVVSVGPTEEGGKFSVQDRGIGIAPESVAKVFNRYERAISHANISGLGLGLYISREIVLAHRGTIGVDSKLGEGSRFTVELPFNPSPVGAAL